MERHWVLPQAFIPERNLGVLCLCHHFVKEDTTQRAQMTWFRTQKPQVFILALSEVSYVRVYLHLWQTWADAWSLRVW